MENQSALKSGIILEYITLGWNVVGCAVVMLAAAVLVSLLCNHFFGVWWIDAVTGFVIAIYSLKEGLHALRG